VAERQDHDLFPVVVIQGDLGAIYWAHKFSFEKVSTRIQLQDMNTFVRSSDFDEWLSKLDDQKAKARILARLLSAAFGNFGDCEPIGEGVFEMRIHVGAGHRVYYTRTGSTVYSFTGWRREGYADKRHSQSEKDGS
jgi:putative addiction module killer protein